MATLKAIRRRIASVKSTQQITRAMKLVAAARLRRAQEALINGRPYHDRLKRISDSLLGSALEAAAPENAKRAMLMVVICSDRGLCGGYNASLLRRAEEQALEARDDGFEVSFLAVGRKAAEHFKRAGRALAGERANNLPRLATVGLARDLAAHVLDRYRSGGIAQAAMVYTQFRSALSQRPQYERLLPVEPPETSAAPPDYLIEPSRAELLPMLLRTYLEAALFHAMLEAEASEHGARMRAMDSATNNASDMISRLTLEMNRARQAAITKELMDIVGGAEALRG